MDTNAALAWLLSRPTGAELAFSALPDAPVRAARTRWWHRLRPTRIRIRVRPRIVLIRREPLR
jgi:hypothetical protein